MEWVETSARSLEAAKEAALDQLGVHEDEADFEILAEPKSGLFGLVRAEARVRARVRPTRPRAKEENRDRGRRSRGRGQPGSPSEGGDQAANNDDQPGGAGRSRSPGRRAQTNRGRKANSNSPTGRGSRQRQPLASGPQSNGDREGAKMSDVSLTEQGELARSFVAGLIARFQLGGSVEGA